MFSYREQWGQVLNSSEDVYNTHIEKKIETKEKRIIGTSTHKRNCLNVHAHVELMGLLFFVIKTQASRTVNSWKDIFVQLCPGYFSKTIKEIHFTFL